VNSLRIEIWNHFESVLAGEDLNFKLDEIRYWRKLLGNINVRLSEECPSARISRNGEGISLEIGKELSQKLTTPQDWIWIIGHELSHFTLGHLNKIRTSKQLAKNVWNYIFDVAIEMRMFRELPFGAPFEVDLRLKPLLVNAQGKQAAVGAFLINPYVWDLAEVSFERFIKERISDSGLRKRAIKFYNSLYDREPKPPMDFDYMVEELLFWLEGVVPIWMPVIVESSLEGVPDWVKKTGRGRRGGRGIVQINEKIEFTEYTIPQIAREIASMVNFDPENRVKRESRVHAMTVMPILGRRSAALLGAGIYPVFFKSKVTRAIPFCFRPQVYLDLSGSMRAHLSQMYGLISKLTDVIGDPIWSFAGDVVPMTIKQLNNGDVPITGGTSMGSVLKHASGKKFRKIIVLGDGQFSESPQDIADMADEKKIEISLVLFKRSISRNCQWLVEEAKRTYAKKVWTVA